MKTHVVLYSRIRDALRNYGIGVGPAKASPSVFDFYRSGQPETETRNALQACATALVDEMASREVMLHIVYLPSVVEADFESVRQAARDRGLELDPDVPFRTYSSITARFGLEALDLRPTFHQIRAEGHLLNVRADFHYSAALSRAVSARVWTSLHLPARSRTQ
jgi:hypothetical protein